MLPPPTESDPTLAVLSIAAAGLLSGMLFLWLLRRQDHRTWVFARAPRLPIRAAAVGDDAWLCGRVRSAAPLRCPWFGLPCVAFTYQVEEERTTTTTDKDGKVQVHTTWETVHAEQQSQDFTLDDDTAAIVVRMAKATNEALVGLGTEHERSDRRHTASALELDAEVSVLGVVQDDRSFAGQREVPCLLTRADPAARVRSSARGEAWLFAFACGLPLVAGGTAMYVGLGASWRAGAGQIALLVLAGVLLALPFWALGTYNRFVRLRQQVLAAFRQVDVDLLVRTGLVPNLVAVVQATAAHERTLLAGLAAFRSGLPQAQAVAAEGAAVAVTRQVLLLHERYPQLRADTVYCDLHRRLWAVEEKLAHTRQLYNDVVKEWNDRIASLPALLVARCCRYRSAPFFAGDDQPVPPPLRAQDAGARR